MNSQSEGCVELSGYFYIEIFGLQLFLGYQGYSFTRDILRRLNIGNITIQCEALFWKRKQTRNLIINRRRNTEKINKTIYNNVKFGALLSRGNVVSWWKCILYAACNFQYKYLFVHRKWKMRWSKLHGLFDRKCLNSVLRGATGSGLAYRADPNGRQLAQAWPTLPILR